MKLIACTLSCLLFLSGIVHAQAPSEVSSMDGILAALYDVISGPAGQKRDWDRMRSLFVPGARLIPTTKQPDGSFATRVLDVDGYIVSSGSSLERGFFEKQVSKINRKASCPPMTGMVMSSSTAAISGAFCRNTSTPSRPSLATNAENKRPMF
jgi:hypothetical protein